MPGLLFVYGTLKRGLCRHSFLAGCEFKGLGKSICGYRMFDLGDYPGLVASSEGRSLPGEIYQVDDESMARLDIVEGVAEGLYRRDRIELESPFDEDHVVTYFYNMSIDGFVEVKQWPPSEANQFGDDQ